ncbi:MAG: hypothetical protein WBD03_06775 [Thermoplasmata archaeon]
MTRDYLRSPVGLASLAVFVTFVAIAIVGSQTSVIDLTNPFLYSPTSLFLVGATSPVIMVFLGGTIASVVGVFLGIVFGLGRRYLQAPAWGLCLGLVSMPLVSLIVLSYLASPPPFFAPPPTDYISMGRFAFIMSLPIAILVSHGLASYLRRTPIQTGLLVKSVRRALPTMIPWWLSGLKYGLVMCVSAMFICEFLSITRWESWGRALHIAYDHGMLVTGEWDFVLPSSIGMALFLASVFMVLDTLERVARNRYGIV